MKDYVYPTIKCLHPKHIKNPYSGDIITVGCGCCKACVLNRHRKMSLLCSFEEEDYKYCMFVTLTYSDVNLPLLHFEPLSNGLYSVVDACPRSNDYQHELFKFRMSSKQKNLLFSKVQLPFPDCVGYCSKRDCQLFVKRFRKNIYKSTNETLRYYAVAEYGPVHFRPHFHFLFFFNSDKVFQVFGQNLYKSWRFGRIDFSLSRSKVSSYVAGYVNSSCDLPRLYTAKQIQPFALHSQFFALGFYKSKAKEIYEDDFNNIIYGCRKVVNNYVEYHPWRTYLSYFFPKCVGFGQKSRREIYASYYLIKVARFYFGEKTTAYAAALMFCECEDSAPLLSAYFRSSLPVKYYVNDDYEKYFNRIYHELNISSHFCDFVCSFFPSFDLALERIINFYDFKDYDNLKNFYSLQEALAIDPKFGIDFIPNLYDNFNSYACHDWLSNTFYHCEVKPLEQSDYYKMLYIDVSCDYEDSIKHKKLNDYNNVLINQLNS